MTIARRTSSGLSEVDSIVAKSRVLRVSIALVVVAAGIASLVSSSRGQWRLDFASDWATTHAVREGDSPYGNALAEVRRRIPDLRDDVTDPNQGIFPNWRPPFRFILALPLTFLSYWAAANLWTLIEALALIISIYVIGRSIGWRRGPSISVAIGVLSLLSVRQDLGLGQINGSLLLLLTACWLGLRKERHDAAGVALGACIAIKVFPVLLLVPLMMRRRVRVVVIAVGTAGVLTLAGIIFVGWNRIDDVARVTFGGYRTFADVGSNVSLAARGGVIASMLALALMVLFLVRTPHRATGDWFWSALPVIMLGWPIVWGHYMILVIPWAMLTLRPTVPRIIIPVFLVAAPQFWPAGWVCTLALALAALFDVFAREPLAGANEPSDSVEATALVAR